MDDVFVMWNQSKGHQTGNDKTLTLLSASMSGSPTPFWTGTIPEPPPSPQTSSATLESATPIQIPSGTSTIVFTFDQSYDRFDGSEEILINLSTPGCENFPIHEKK